MPSADAYDADDVQGKVETPIPDESTNLRNIKAFSDQLTANWATEMVGRALRFGA